MTLTDAYGKAEYRDAGEGIGEEVGSSCSLEGVSRLTVLIVGGLRHARVGMLVGRRSSWIFAGCMYRDRKSETFLASLIGETRMVDLG